LLAAMVLHFLALVLHTSSTLVLKTLFKISITFSGQFVIIF
jgi:hypothetical protein